MPTEVIYNPVSSYVVGSGMDADSTTVTLNDASLFPTVCNYRVQIEQEIMIVTAIAGAVLTVTRGAEGSAALPHSVGTLCQVIVSAGALYAVFSALP